VIRRGPLSDVLTVDGESVALMGSRVFRLGPVAGAILEMLADGPLPRDSIEARLVALFGAPPDQDTTEAVAAQLRELAGHGLITIDA